MYGRPRPVWLQDVVFTLGSGAVAYGAAQLARRTGKPTVPALVAIGAGVTCMVARNYARDELVQAGLEGAAGGGIGYGWVFAAANTFGRAGIPLMVPAATTKSSPAAAGRAAGGRVIDIASRQAQGRRSSVASRGLALG